MSDPVRLAATGLACRRGGRLLFTGIAFDLSPGQALRVTGPNGAGKSSLIRVLAGLLPPYAGTVERRGDAAMMNESLAMDEDLPLAEALRFWCIMDGRGEEKRRAGDALHDTGMADLAAVPVRLLSTGQRRRAALARVVSSGAPIWLLDEPANGLDARAVARLESLIERHRAGGGIAMVATHQPLGLPGAAELAIEAAS